MRIFFTNQQLSKMSESRAYGCEKRHWYFSIVSTVNTSCKQLSRVATSVLAHSPATKNGAWGPSHCNNPLPPQRGGGRVRSTWEGLRSSEQLPHLVKHATQTHVFSTLFGCYFSTYYNSQRHREQSWARHHIHMPNMNQNTTLQPKRQRVLFNTILPRTGPISPTVHNTCKQNTLHKHMDLSFMSTYYYSLSLFITTTSDTVPPTLLTTTPSQTLLYMTST